VDHFRTPFDASLQQVTRAEASSAAWRQGKALPCTVVSIQNALVTVSFDIQSGYTIPHIQMPVAQWFYARMPVQVGDRGVTMPADVFLGGASGLGPGTADFGRQGNLANLVFVPVSNAGWAGGDGNAVRLTGVGTSGVVLSSGDGNAVLTVNSSGMTLALGGAIVAAFSTAGLNVTDGDVKADTISLKAHLTSDVTTGSGQSGPPVPP